MERSLSLTKKDILIIECSLKQKIVKKICRITEKLLPLHHIVI